MSRKYERGFQIRVELLSYIVPPHTKYENARTHYSWSYIFRQIPFTTETEAREVFQAMNRAVDRVRRQQRSARKS